MRGDEKHWNNNFDIIALLPPDPLQPLLLHLAESNQVVKVLCFLNKK